MSMLEEAPEAEVIDLEPTLVLDLADPGSAGPRPRFAPGVAAAEGSLVGETHGLRRKRLAAAALFLAGACALLFVWYAVYPVRESSALALTLVGLRVVCAAGVAGLLLSRASLTRHQVQLAEFTLFGSFTFLMAVNQYVVGLDMLRHDDLSGAIAFAKNGTFGLVLLMVIYGMFIPNDPRTTAKVVLTMALTKAVVAVLVLEHPEVYEAIGRIREIDSVGSNVLFLIVGAALAIYGSFLLNGLRVELHEARKFGQYRLVRKLGAGGMGEVYLAEHQLLKRPCALKLIRPEAGADPVAVARFEREVQASARLAHPNSIAIYDYGHTDDGTFYYVMEYLQGLSLGDLVRDFGPLPAGRVIYLFRQACAGLAEAHGLGLVHRDLKPANLFVAVRGGEADVAKVLDFGLVKLTQGPRSASLTGDMTVSGTPLYMAPEQAQGDRSLDARADVYALGAMMYHALTGRPPFQGENAFAVMIAHSRDPVVPPSQVRPDVPRDLDGVVLRCMAKKPGDRYPTVKALAEALSSCASAPDWGPHRAEAWWASHAAGALDGPRADPAGLS